jgi:sugar phosphate isomerase/epimerase
MIRSLALSILLSLGSQLLAAQPFFAMDTGAKGPPAEVAQMLAELKYDGLGGSGYQVKPLLEELAKNKLRLFNVYLTLKFDSPPAVSPELNQLITDLSGHDSCLWIALQKVENFKNSDPAGDSVARAHLQAIADAAKAKNVPIALYPHTGFWLARVDDAIRLTDQLDRPDVGVTFNLCHWLKVEGDTDPAPTLKRALPRLRFVTLNGADSGETKDFGWDRLIQPLDAGSFDNASLLKTLRDLGYTGPVGLQSYGLKGDQKALLARSRQAWDRFNAVSR